MNTVGKTEHTAHKSEKYDGSATLEQESYL